MGARTLARRWRQRWTVLQRTRTARSRLLLPNMTGRTRPSRCRWRCEDMLPVDILTCPASAQLSQELLVTHTMGMRRLWRKEVPSKATPDVCSGWRWATLWVLPATDTRSFLPHRFLKTCFRIPSVGLGFGSWAPFTTRSQREVGPIGAPELQAIL